MRAAFQFGMLVLELAVLYLALGARNWVAVTIVAAALALNLRYWGTR